MWKFQHLHTHTHTHTHVATSSKILFIICIAHMFGIGINIRTYAKKIHIMTVFDVHLIPFFFVLIIKLSACIDVVIYNRTLISYEYVHLDLLWEKISYEKCHTM